MRQKIDRGAIECSERKENKGAAGYARKRTIGKEKHLQDHTKRENRRYGGISRRKKKKLKKEDEDENSQYYK